MAFLTFQGLYFFQVAPVVERQVAKQQKILNHVQEDIEFIRAQPELAPLLPKAEPGGPDAAEFFASWTKTGGVMVPLETRQALLRLEDRWLEGYMKMDPWKLDLSPLQKLQTYQAWYMDQTDARPETQELLSAAKLRLMQGARGQNPGPALREVRHLAQLLLSSGELEYAQLGLTLLDMERRAHRLYTDRGWMLDEWKTVDRQVLKRAPRLLAALPGFMRFWSEPKTLSKLFFESAENIPGYCAVVSQILPTELLYEGWLGRIWPFEHSFPDGFMALKRIDTRAQTLCAWTGLLVLRKRSEEQISKPGPPLLNRLPYARSLFVTWTSANVPPNFNAYLHDWNAKPTKVLKSGEGR